MGLLLSGRRGRRRKGRGRKNKGEGRAE